MMQFNLKAHIGVRAAAAAMLAVLATGCATMVDSPRSTSASSGDIDAMLGMMMRGESQMNGGELEAAIEAASAYPLGSRENPVRAHMPPGQRAYLSRLRCSDTSRPSFSRAGNLGPGVYGNIVDLYIVTCSGGEPERAEIVMDMYHAGYAEEEPVPGFGIAGGRKAE